MRPRKKASVATAAIVFAFASGLVRTVHADEAIDAPGGPEERTMPALPAPRTTIPYVRGLATVMVGTGLRFNNPYRLATPLGKDAESLSRTATYLDLGLAALFGSPRSFQHGLGMRVDFAVEGISQQLMSPTYLLCRQWRTLQPCARIAVPIVLAPDANVGFEAALGVSYYVRAGIGVMAEGVFDLFYGASTREARYPAYPILSGQAGLVVSYEALP